MKVIRPAEILLPNTPLENWAVVACDQFTSEKKYWEELKAKTAGKVTALNVILPEVYLKEDNSEEIAAINSSMESYLKSGVFSNVYNGFVLVVRRTPFNGRRIGLILSVDLEEYSFVDADKALIRATEGTIIERLPPRVRIRENAPMEFPHIMLLFDDERREITEELYKDRDKFQKIYDFELNMGGGHIEGYHIPKTDDIIEKFENLLEENRLKAKYGKNEKFLFAVGDGNHSLATAKSCWNRIKPGLSLKERENHPARYALLEAVNIYDEGIVFEPIHRIVKNIDVGSFIKKFTLKQGQEIKLITDKGDIPVFIPEDIGEGIRYVDGLIANAEADYIHGEESLRGLVGRDSVGVLLKKMEKDTLFKSVISNGALPRKTFSMGEAVEKRYYLEGKMIKD